MATRILGADIQSCQITHSLAQVVLENVDNLYPNSGTKLILGLF
jgi:hypothetical protein